jgi:hypothetical protein
MRFWYYAIRCWLGRPVTYRDYQDDGDWWYAKCLNCNRQTEVHEGIGGPPTLPALLDDDDEND